MAQPTAPAAPAGSPIPNSRPAGCTVTRDLNTALLLFAALTLACFAIEFVCARFLHLSAAHTWPLPPYNLRFCDFTVFIPRFQRFHTPAFFSYAGSMPFTYPPGAATAFEPFYFFRSPLAAFLAAMACVYIAAAVLLLLELRRHALPPRASFSLLLLFALSYPLWLDIQQANCEWIVWAVLTLGLLAFLRRRPYAAALCFGLAGAMKLYPIILLGLFLPRRQYRHLAAGIATAAAAYIASLWLETGSIADSLRGSAIGMAYLRDTLFLDPTGSWNHSLWFVVKQVFVVVSSLRHHHFHLPSPLLLLHAETAYFVTFAAIATLLFFTRIRKLPLLNQIFLLTLACILLPPLSMDYTLIQLFFPCTLLVLSALRYSRHHRGAPMPGFLPAMLLMAWLLAPETWILYGNIAESSATKTLALLALTAIFLRYPFPAPYADPTPDPSTRSLHPRMEQHQPPRADTLRHPLCQAVTPPACHASYSRSVN